MSADGAVRGRLAELGRQRVRAAPQLYVDVDVEADGIAGFGSMLSIGAVTAGGHEFYSEISPSVDEFLPAQRRFCDEHGLERNRLQREAPAADAVMHAFAEWLRGVPDADGRRPVFAAFNASFDWAFVDLYFARAGIGNPFGIAPFDLKSLALTLDADWDWSSTSKRRLPNTIAPAREFTHHALEDARYQQEIHFALSGALAARPPARAQ